MFPRTQVASLKEPRAGPVEDLLERAAAVSQLSFRQAAVVALAEAQHVQELDRDVGPTPSLPRAGELLVPVESERGRQIQAAGGRGHPDPRSRSGDQRGGLNRVPGEDVALAERPLLGGQEVRDRKSVV